MRKTLLIVIIAVLAFGVLNAETKLKMELWNRWTYAMENGNVTENEMALKRGYLRLEPKFTGKIKGRFNLDFYSSDSNSDAAGVGIKLKYAYLDFSELLPVANSKVTIGLMKTYFGTIYDWDYTTIDKDPSDKYKFVSSTDYGLGFGGYLPNGMGTYNIAAYNGEGYKKVGDDINKDMNFVANLRVTPIVGVTVGGSYMMKTKNDSQIDDGSGEMIDNPDRIQYNMMAGVGKLAFGKFSLLAQYLNKITTMPNMDGSEDETETVISLLPVFKINNSIDFIGRYDLNDPNTDVDGDAETTITAGFNYHILRDSKNNPKLFVQTNYQMVQPEDEDADTASVLAMQLRWIFSETINKK